MRLLCPMGLAFALLLTPLSGEGAGCNPPGCQNLKGITRVKFLVESLAPATKELGITREDLRSTALVALRSKLPRLEVSRDAKTYIYVSVVAYPVAGGFAAHVSMQLYKYVWKKNLSLVLEVYWNESSLLAGPRSDASRRVGEEVEKYLTRFAADWDKANPGK